MLHPDFDETFIIDREYSWYDSNFIGHRQGLENIRKISTVKLILQRRNDPIKLQSIFIAVDTSLNIHGLNVDILKISQFHYHLKS